MIHTHTDANKKMTTDLRYELTHPDAKPPLRAYPDDAGFDVSIVAVHKVLGPGCVMFDTGLRVSVDPGFYTELVPRSSFAKSGYMLANSVGIIDHGYRGNIFVALRKMDPDAPDLQLPYKGFQLIVREMVKVPRVCTSSGPPLATNRGTGGFGSTG